MLITNKVQESKTIEYKAKISLKGDEEKKEFLYDVSSFANAAGGDILFGVAEDKEKGFPAFVNGIEGNMDELQTTIENMLRDSINPRIINIKMKPIKLEKNNYSVLIIHIPKSFNSPHQVIFKGVNKFYSRSNNGKYILDVHELRNAFSLSDTLVQKLKTFVTERISKIIADETPVELENIPKIILHCIPLSSFNSPPNSLQLDLMRNKAPPALGSWGSNQRTNFEGILNFNLQRGQTKNLNYLQAYRNGVIETVNADLLRPFDGQKFIPADGEISFEYVVLRSVVTSLAYFETMNIPTPIYFFLSFVGVKNYTIGSSHLNIPTFRQNPIDKYILFLPEIAVQSYKDDITTPTKEWFNMIWNASGYNCSLTYDKNGYVQRLLSSLKNGTPVS